MRFVANDGCSCFLCVCVDYRSLYSWDCALIYIGQINLYPTRTTITKPQKRSTVERCKTHTHTHRITPTHWRRWKNLCREYYSFTFALKATRKAGATNYVNALTASRKCHPSFTTNTNNTLNTYTYISHIIRAHYT